ncbi:MAG: cobalt-precorrin-5B (C(1))-methyltransferase CbiD [Vulcanococcus sp.]
MAASGYTLPVWVAAAARAALGQLLAEPFAAEPLLQLDPGGGGRPTPMPVQAAALLAPGRALATARCDPGEGLDLTSGLQVWVELSWLDPVPAEGPWLQLEAGEGVGIHAASGDLCHSAFARQLLEANLAPLRPAGLGLHLRLTLPAGRALAARTSNAAFGVVDGLALIGTQAEVQRSAAPDQLAAVRAELARRAAQPGGCPDLVLVIGENGLDLAPQLGLPPELLLKAGNGLGPALVAAAEQGVRRLLLFGYQGKLIKLAGGIFHTHHHLADGRLEVLTALGAVQGLPTAQLQALHAAASVDQALAELARQNPAAAAALRAAVALAVEQRSVAYLARYGQQAMAVGALLFDRRRQLCAEGPRGAELLRAWRLGGPEPEI